MSKNILNEGIQLSGQQYLWGEAMDAAFFTAFTKRLYTPLNRMPAYRLGLISKTGMVIKEPETQEERRALSFLDRLVLFVRQTAGGRVNLLFNAYRKQRVKPEFIRAASRAVSLRFFRYYDMETGFFDKPGLF